MIGNSVPLDAATLAKAWRRSCGRTTSSPTLCPIARHGFSRLTSTPPGKYRKMAMAVARPRPPRHPRPRRSSCLDGLAAVAHGPRVGSELARVR